MYKCCRAGFSLLGPFT